MSNQKSNQPGAPAHKHISFTPASEVNGGPEGADQHETSASSQAGGRQNDEQKSWLDQQQWLKNVDMDQLSQQAKDLGVKAKDLGNKAKDLGTKAVEQVNRLTPTQKVVGGALLVSGLSWLALRAKSGKGQAYGADENTAWQGSSDSVYRGATARNHADDDDAAL
ncbi:hypothetical protein [Hymenobacter rubripertinctus]|uniref:Uncharacterized protein n=1 Tax=Hymenobacter rubripertinctus TaxID=2029981 RepID=A0A418R5T3_9BACT|nr:hypothetical protein [Hymenobacter rubripertinctus]RIY12813.1 hypothetical protein D0T11_03565 [Hymenobacter rubripertinctus]